MSKKAKLNEYRKVRSIRDELIISDNLGRKRKLLMDLPGVKRIEYISGGSVYDTCIIELESGHEFTSTTKWRDKPDCIVKCGLIAYQHWLKNIL